MLVALLIFCRRGPKHTGTSGWYQTHLRTFMHKSGFEIGTLCPVASAGAIGLTAHGSVADRVLYLVRGSKHLLCNSKYRCLCIKLKTFCFVFVFKCFSVGKKVRIYSQSLYNCWGMYIFDYPKNKRELKKINI